MIPITGFKPEAKKWLSSENATEIEPRPCFVFSEASFPPGVNGLVDYFKSGAWISWLGGPGISGIEWPCNSSGKPLAHVATFCISEAQPHPEMAASWNHDYSLPEGFLEIYHDLESYGTDPEDKHLDGWLVRYIPNTNSLDLVHPESVPESISGAECQQGLLMPGFTLPAFADLENDVSNEFELWEKLTEELQNTWHEQRFGEKADYPIPFTHLGGHSWHGNTEVEEVLQSVLPVVTGADNHILLVTIESWTALNGWFGDAGSLEVWMRESDLKNLDFSKAWCIIRTG